MHPILLIVLILALISVIGSTYFVNKRYSNKQEDNVHKTKKKE